MPLRRFTFFDQKTNEWLYDFLVNLGPAQKGALNSAELYQIRNKSAIKSFVSNGLLEKKLILLTKLGVEFFIVFAPRKEVTKELILGAYRQYARGTQSEIVDQMLATKTFVLSSRDVAISLGMMNMNCHSDVWVPNMEFIRVRKVYNEAAANISRGMSEKNMNREFMTALNGLRVVTNIFNQALLSEPFITSLGLQVLDIVILNELMDSRNNYVSVEYLRKQFKASYQPKSITNRCNILWKQKGLLDKMPSSEQTPSFRITDQGILVVGQVANYVVNYAAQKG